MVVWAVDAVAQGLGLRPGTALAQAQAMVPGLVIADADPAGDAAALVRLAAWCLRLSPLTAADTDGIWIDATGCTHLHGGERPMLGVIQARLAEDGVVARAAIADTPGAAHALARYAADAVTVAPPGGTAAALAPLPVAALRLESEAVAMLRRLGLDTVGDLAALPRAPFARRFGAAVLQRLDQAMGRVAEPITPVTPPNTPQARLAFPEPLLTAESFVAVIARLVRRVCHTLECAGQGARHLDLLFDRVDGGTQAIRIGTARPSRDARHLARLLEEQVERVEPGLGVEAMRLVVPLAEPLAFTQTTNLAAGMEADIAMLVDRLSNRLGGGRVWRAAPVQSDVPERSVARVAAVAAPLGASWPGWPRPARLLHPPQAVQATSALPDHPPAAFVWRRRQHRVRRADGPERIQGEWWRRDGEWGAVRDYWQVEDETGRRFWLYRRGDGQHAATGDLQWFLHGVF
jgi:protein ImuB